MQNLLKQIDKQKIRAKSKSNMKNNYKSEDLVFLINGLNTDIKVFYQSIKKCLNEGKNNNNNIISSQQILNLVEQYLNEFIDKAKDKFKKMRYIRKINIIQQDINENRTNLDLGYNKMKLSTDNIFLDNKEFNNKINVNNKLLNKKQIFDEAINTSSKCNNKSCNSLKINNFIDRNIICYDNLNNNYINEYTRKYKHINNYSYNNKIYNHSHGTNYNIRKTPKFFNNNFNNSSESNIQNYNQFNDKNIKNKKTKSVNDIRKKILMNRNTFNSNSNKDTNYYSANHTQANKFSSKKEMLNNLNEIISLLKEIKLINGNIFNKSWEAEKHQKLLNKIYYELNNLISNIFNNYNLYNNKDNTLSINMSNKSLIGQKDKRNNNSSYNLTYNFDSINNNKANKDKTKIIKALLNYDNEIQSRDLIIKKLKQELDIKDKRLQQQNLKYNQLKSILNNKKEENIKLNNISKMNIEELEEKLKKYEKYKTKNNNIEKHFNLINQKYNELKKVNELITSNNGKLKEQIKLLHNQLDINRNKKNNFLKLENINIEAFSIISNSFCEETQKIIDELKNELQIKNEINEKNNNEINDYKNNENNLKEEISKLNNDINSNKEEIIKLKEEISKLNDELSKNKEDLIKIKKENESLIEKNNQFINENKYYQETIDKQKKLLAFQEEEINSLKERKETDKISDSNNIINDGGIDDNSFNNINKDDKKNKKRNNSKQIDQLQIEQDKIVLKYELLKNDYDKLNSTLQQKQKLLDNYSKLSSETSTKANIDEQILELIAQHKKEMDDLTEKYNQNIINLKMNLPVNCSPNTHCILIDKKYSKFNLRWFLLTITTAQDKNYENTFWVSEDEIKPMLNQFNTFKTEKELEDEQFESIYITQQKWIKQIDENERLIAKLKQQLQKYEISSTS